MGKGAYGEPDWATPGSNAAATETSGVPTAGPISMSSATGKDRSSFILAALSFCCFGLSVMMCALGILTLINFVTPASNDVSEAFLAVYMVLFAVLLFSYELMWWMTIPWINKLLRKNFGFLYGLQGKGFYLIFVAFLCMGLGDDNSVKELTWATGISFLAFGVIHVMIVCMKPELTLKYQAPTAGLNFEEGTTGTPAETQNPV